MEEKDEEKNRLEAIREKLESHIMSTFQGKEMWYQEKRLQYKGTPDITTDAWGVTVHFECKRAQPVHLSRRWDFIIAYEIISVQHMPDGASVLNAHTLMGNRIRLREVVKQSNDDADVCNDEENFERQR